MGKDSFIVYTSFYKPISILSDKQLGRLFRAIFKYHLGEVVNVEEDIRMAFEFFKNQFEIDESKYQAKIRRDVENGHKGGNPNFKKGKTNPYYKDNKKITQDNPGLCKDNPNITQDKAINDNEYDNDIKEKPLSGEKENPINPIFDLELDECERLLRSQEEWKQTLCMNNRSSGFGWFTMEDLDAYITKFFMKLRNEGGGRKTLKDAKSHFARWLAIELKNDMSGYNRELRNSTDDKELKSFISYMERKCPNCFVNMKMPNEEQFGNLRKTMDKKEIAELSEKIENRKTLQGNRNSLYTTMLEMKEYG